MDVTATCTGKRNRLALRATSAESPRAARRPKRDGSQPSIRSFLNARRTIDRAAPAAALGNDQPDAGTTADRGRPPQRQTEGGPTTGGHNLDLATTLPIPHGETGL
eukprot:5581286-Lingulodinium_polyedra.AAC.1